MYLIKEVERIVEQLRGIYPDLVVGELQDKYYTIQSTNLYQRQEIKCLDNFILVFEYVHSHFKCFFRIGDKKEICLYSGHLSNLYIDDYFKLLYNFVKLYEEEERGYLLKLREKYVRHARDYEIIRDSAENILTMLDPKKKEKENGQG